MHLGHEAGLVEELRLRANETPEAPALFAPGLSPLSYEDLCRHVGYVAQTLRRAGLRRSDTVALVLPDGPDVLSAFLGVAEVAACAPLNPALREAEFEFYLLDLGARLLMVPAGVLSPAAAVARSLAIPVLEVQPDPGRTAGLFTLHGDATALPPPSERADDDGAVLLLHTSATTGRPKLVPLTNENFRAMLANFQNVLGLTRADRFISMMPLFHLQGLVSSFAQLLAGGSVVCTSGFQAGRFIPWLEEYRPTWYTAGPTLHHAIVAVAREAQDTLRRCPLRFTRSIGAPLPPDLLADLERTLHAPVLDGYGLTEAGVTTSFTLAPESSKPGAVGKPAGPEVAIMSDSGVLLPPDEVGEIVLRGPSVMSGYRNNPEANRETFRNGWFCTGDLGRLDPDGFLFVTGRKKEMINRGGEKVLPLDVDLALAAHPAVAEVAAFAIPHPTLGEDVAAAVVLRPGASATEPELRRFAAGRLAPFKVPRRIVFMDAIPRGATGKPKRLAMAEQARAEPSFVSPSTPDQMKLAGIWARILNKDEVGLYDDFFSLGGDSFALTVMLTEVQAHFLGDRKLDTFEFLATPDLTTLAQVIAQCQSADAPEKTGAILTLQPHGTRPPFFCVPGASEDPFYFRHIAAHLGADQPTHALRDTRSLPERGLHSVEEAASFFVETLRTAQPRGPYFLGGHCYGGAVVYEMARQLAAQGHEIGLLALFDTPMPGYPQLFRNRRLFWERLKLHLRSIRRASPAAAVRSTLSQLKAFRGFLGRRTTPPAAASPLPLDANTSALLNYRPAPFPGPVVQFIGLEDYDSDSVLDPRQGWREVAAHFTVIKVPGTHESMFVEPNAAHLAGRLKSLLGGR